MHNNVQYVTTGICMLVHDAACPGPTILPPHNIKRYKLITKDSLQDMNEIKSPVTVIYTCVRCGTNCNPQCYALVLNRYLHMHVWHV